jgi:regulatory protein
MTKGFTSAEEPTPGSSADLVPEADPESVARTIVLNALTASAKTRFQLAERLAERNIPDDVATKVLNRFTEVGLIDDLAFAKNWVLSRSAGRGLARRALVMELKRKGVEGPIIDQALELLTVEDEEKRARALVEAKARSLEGLPRDKKYARITGMLSRKGYSGAITSRLASEYSVRDLGSDGDSD